MRAIIIANGDCDYPNQLAAMFRADDFVIAVDGGARQGVTDATFLVVIRFQQFVLFFLRQPGKHFGAGVGNGAADSEKLLELFVGVHKYRYFAFRGLITRAECVLPRGIEAVLCLAGSLVYLDRSAFGESRSMLIRRCAC